MNEGVLRSPKWLRNFVDFEVNTGQDIKGEPSKKRKKQLEEERLRNEEKMRKERVEKEEKSRKEREEREEKEKEEEKELLEDLATNAFSWIEANYKICDITTSAARNEITFIKAGLTYGKNVKKDLDFEVTLENSYTIPSFRVKLKYDNIIYSVNVSGLSFVRFRNYIMDVIYPWYQKIGQYQQNTSGSSSNQSNQNSYKSSGTWSKQSTSNPNDTEEIKKKRRLYILLKDTLAGYQRQMDTIVEWEKKNPGKKHTDRETTKNEIENVKDKIKNIKDKYKFESLNHLKSFIFY
jgi:hypothetical protein